MVTARVATKCGFFTISSPMNVFVASACEAPQLNCQGRIKNTYKRIKNIHNKSRIKIVIMIV
jgi:hypothetical protein